MDFDRTLHGSAELACIEGGCRGASGVAGEDLCEHGVVCCVSRLCQL